MKKPGTEPGFGEALSGAYGEPATWPKPIH